MDPQQRHELLIDLLSKHPSYNRVGHIPRLSKRKKHVGSDDLDKLNVGDVNSAVILVVDALNMPGGSIGGNVDLYRLLQAYFLVPSFRERINDLADEALAQERKKQLERTPS